VNLPSFVSEGSSGTIVAVFVQPRAARDAIVGVHGNALKVKVSAPALEGRANRAVESLLAERLDISPRAVNVVAGASSRSKRIEIRDLDPATVALRLERARGA
jgi:uncharacterized protein (TIGR00251 family)